MSNLLVDRINTSLEQEITVDITKRAHLAAIIPYLYLHNSPAGTFTLDFKKGADVLYSYSFTSNNVKFLMNITDDYAHVFYPIIPGILVPLESGSYSVKITASGGYSPTETSYLGWVKQYDNIQNGLDYTVVNDTYAPYAIRFKTYN